MSVGRKQTIVTGGAGFIGRHLIAALNERGEENILVVDRLGSGDKWKNLRGLRFDDFVEVADFRRRVREQGLPQTVTVFHLGASFSATGQDVDELVDKNYRHARELCEACLKSGARFIYASCAETYGGGELGHFDNEAMLADLRPLTPYGFSKHLFDLWAARSGALAKVTGLKYFDVYGPHEDHKGAAASLVHKLFAQIRATGAATLFKGHAEDCADGEQQRDFIHVQDAIAMTLFCYERPEVLGLFNCGSGKARTALEVARAVFSMLGIEPNIRFVDLPEDLRATSQFFAQADLTKIRNAGFDHDFVSLEDGVKTLATDGVATPVAS